MRVYLRYDKEGNVRGVYDSSLAALQASIDTDRVVFHIVESLRYCSRPGCGNAVPRSTEDYCGDPCTGD